MRFLQLKERGRIRIRISPTEVAALRKIVELGLDALDSADAFDRNPLTTGERKAMAYWKGNPFKDWPKKPRRKPASRPRTPAKPRQGGKPTPTAQSRPGAL